MVIPYNPYSLVVHGSKIGPDQIAIKALKIMANAFLQVGKIRLDDSPQNGYMFGKLLCCLAFARLHETSDSLCCAHKQETMQSLRKHVDSASGTPRVGFLKRSLQHLPMLWRT